MLIVTEEAVALLRQAMEERELGANECLRLARDGSNFRLEVDSPVQGDRVIEYEGIPVLLLDPVAEETLGDVVLGAHAGDEGSCLILEESDAESRALR